MQVQTPDEQAEETLSELFLLRWTKTQSSSSSGPCQLEKIITSVTFHELGDMSGDLLSSGFHHPEDNH